MKLGRRRNYHKGLAPIRHYANQTKALVGAFSVIVKTGCGTDGSFYSTNIYRSILYGNKMFSVSTWEVVCMFYDIHFHVVRITTKNRVLFEQNIMSYLEGEIMNNCRKNRISTEVSLKTYFNKIKQMSLCETRKSGLPWLMNTRLINSRFSWLK